MTTDLNLNIDPKISCGQRVRQVRAMVGLTRLQLQEESGIKHSILAKWESGLTMLSLKGAQQLILFLRERSIYCTADWLMEGTGTPPEVISPTYTPPLSSRNDRDALKDDADFLILEEIRAFKSIYNNSLITLVKNDGMYPLFSEGDYVGGIIVPKDSIQKCYGKPCIVEYLDGSKDLRVVTESQKKKTLCNLSISNPKSRITKPTQFDIELRHIAPVVWHRYMSW